MKKLHLIQLKGVPISEQLELEEKLLRHETQNFCVINQEPDRAIVMGISGKEEHLLEMDLVKRDGIPVLRRFSGGGTVILDESSLMISFIFAKKEIPVTPFPEPILRWSADLYKAAWQIPGFALRENDYVIHDKKCGGNAQYIKKDRWLHHTSFLWDYKNENMKYLKLPEKRPNYRLSRSHGDFLCKLKDQQFKTSCELIDLLKEVLETRFLLQLTGISHVAPHENC